MQSDNALTVRSVSQAGVGSGNIANVGQMIAGSDNSIFLLAEGIISVLIVAFGVAIYALSLRDACGVSR
jgi:arabinogalactan oligomer/maltooligosaccharide transport system permease protein